MAEPQFLDLPDTDPSLGVSPMIRGIEKTLAYIAENGSICLTPSGAFKRVFVEWAAREFDWPGHRPSDLYAVNKVLNEQDFFPLVELHDILLALKIGRHFKGEFRLTSKGGVFAGRPGHLFSALAPFYLFRMDHGRYSRTKDDPLLGNWDIFLNVINVVAEGGVSAVRLREELYGAPEAGQLYGSLSSCLHQQVLRPLCWLGLLAEQGDERRSRGRIYVKTPLWRAALHLDADAIARVISTD